MSVVGIYLELLSPLLRLGTIDQHKHRRITIQSTRRCIDIVFDLVLPRHSMVSITLLEPLIR